MKQNNSLLAVAHFALITYCFQLHPTCTNPANLDTTFGSQNTGIVEIDFGVLIQTGDGGILVDDQGRITSVTTINTGLLGFGLSRLLSNGDLDDNFANEGKVIINFAGIHVRSGGGIVRDSKNRLIASGDTTPPADDNYVLIRVLEDGSLDPSFGDNGKVLGTTNNVFDVSGMKLNKEEKIVILGFTTTNDLIVVQLNQNGSLDTTFGNGGISIIDLGATDFTEAELAIDRKGRIVAVGSRCTTSCEFVVVRLNPDGSLDQTFGTNGKSSVEIDQNDFFGGGIAITAANEIVVLGDKNSDDFVVFKLTESGALSKEFGNNGIVIIDNNSAGEGGIVIDSWGNIYLFGERSVVRLKSDGSFDTTFGSGGITTLPATFTSQRGGIVIDAQGRIVLLGETVGTDNIAVARLCGNQFPRLTEALREKYQANASILP